jgi:signal transduction histidine kinase
MITALSSILHALNAHLNVSDAFPEIAVGLRQLSGCDQSGIALFDESGQWLCLMASDPSLRQLGHDIRFHLTDTAAEADILAGRMHVIADLASELNSPLERFLYTGGYRSRLNVPLRGQEGIYGTLNLTWREPNAFKAIDLDVLSHVAEAVTLAVERSRLFEQTRAGGERLETLSRRLLQVQEEERRHLARELHDEVGQVLTALKFSLDIIDRDWPQTARPRISEAQHVLDALIARVRNLSLDLRPPILDDLGLLPALLWLFERFTLMTNVYVRFAHRGLGRRFSPEIETGAYRIVQEALTNAARHAGVNEATVRIWADSGTLHVHIIDEGRGFDPARLADTTGGLQSMRERANLLGGHLTIESAPGKGTRVYAELVI